MTSRVEGYMPDNFVTSSRWRGEMPYRKVVEPQRQIRKALAGMKPFYSRPFNRLDTWRYGTAAAIDYWLISHDPGLGRTDDFAAHTEELIIALNEGVLTDADLIKLARMGLVLRPRASHDRFVSQGAKDFINAVASGRCPPEQRQVLLMDTMAAVSHLRRQSFFLKRLPRDEQMKAAASMEPRVRALGSLWQSLDAVLLDSEEMGWEERAGLIQDDLLLWRIGMSFPEVLARLAAFMPDMSLGEWETQAAAVVSTRGVGDTAFLEEFRKRREALDQDLDMSEARATSVQPPSSASGSQRMLFEAAAVAMSIFPSTHPGVQESFHQVMGEERERRRKIGSKLARIRSFVSLGEVIYGYWRKTWKSPLPGSPFAQQARRRSLSLSLAAMAELVKVEAEDFPPAWVPIDGGNGAVWQAYHPRLAADSERFSRMVNYLIGVYYRQYVDDKEAVKRWNAGAAQAGDGEVALPSNRTIPDHGLMELAYRLLGEVGDSLTPQARESVLDVIEDQGRIKNKFCLPRTEIMKILGLLAKDDRLAERAMRLQGELLAAAAIEMVLNAPLTVTRTSSFEAGVQYGSAHVVHNIGQSGRDPIGWGMKYDQLLRSLAISLEKAGQRRGEVYTQFLYLFVIQLASADTAAKLLCLSKQREWVPDRRFHFYGELALASARTGKHSLDSVLAELAMLLTQTEFHYWQALGQQGTVEPDPNAVGLSHLLGEMLKVSDRSPDTAMGAVAEIFGGGVPPESGTRPEAGKGEEAADEEGVIEAPYQIVDVGGA